MKTAPEQPRVMKEVEAAVKAALAAVVGVEAVNVSANSMFGFSLFLTVNLSKAAQLEVAQYLIERGGR